jgi:hypothetical protein
MSTAANIALFQIGWFACVLSAAHGMPWIGALTVAAVVARHVFEARHPRRELALIGTAAAIGAMFETLLAQSGWVRFTSGVLFAGVAPYWMVSLWALFATTLNVSLRSLRPHPVLASILGAVGGPLAYYGGARLGALEFAAAGAALAAIAIGWLVLAPALLSAARRLDGYTQP